MKVYVVLRNVAHEGSTLLGAKPSLDAAKKVVDDYVGDEDEWAFETPPGEWKESHAYLKGTKAWRAEGDYFDYEVVEIEMEDE